MNARKLLPSTTNSVVATSSVTVRTVLSFPLAESNAATNHPVHNMRMPAQGGSTPIRFIPSRSKDPARITSMLKKFSALRAISAAVSRSG